MQKTIKAADIFHAISDPGSLQIFNFIATYIMKKGGLQADQAIRIVKDIRGRKIRRKKQLDTLKEYESYLHSKNS